MAQNKNDQQRIFTNNDFLQGDSVNKAYFSVFGKVYDLTNIIEEQRDSTEGDNMIDWIGKDISHFFNKKSGLPIQQNPDLKNLTSQKG